MDVLRILGNSALMLTSFITALATGGFPSGIALTNNTSPHHPAIMMSISLTNLRLRGLRVRDHAVPVRRAFLPPWSSPQAPPS